MIISMYRYPFSFELCRCLHTQIQPLWSTILTKTLTAALNMSTDFGSAEERKKEPLLCFLSISIPSVFLSLSSLSLSLLSPYCNGRGDPSGRCLRPPCGRRGRRGPYFQEKSGEERGDSHRRQCQRGQDALASAGGQRGEGVCVCVSVCVVVEECVCLCVCAVVEERECVCAVMEEREGRERERKGERERERKRTRPSSFSTLETHGTHTHTHTHRHTHTHTHTYDLTTSLFLSPSLPLSLSS